MGHKRQERRCLGRDTGGGDDVVRKGLTGGWIVESNGHAFLSGESGQVAGTLQSGGQASVLNEWGRGPLPSDVEKDGVFIVVLDQVRNVGLA